MILENIAVGMLETNCYILGCERTRQAVVIDPGDDALKIRAMLRHYNLTLTRLVATHAHFDHILAARELQETSGAPFSLHPADEPLLRSMRQTAIAWTGRDPGSPPTVNGLLLHGETMRVGDVALEVRSAPGHSPGGVVLVDHEGHRAFTGDAIFAGSIGRTDLPGGDLDTLLEAIRREILSLPDGYSLLPGHGPSTSVREERTSNPFLAAAPTPVRWH
jgi:hydroxyacylglutathione hydrolase